MVFATQCVNCHLGTEVEGAELPIQPAGQSLVEESNGVVALSLGVETLETIRARQGPGERWALDMSAAQFDADDGYVVKVSTVHADPWVTHNLQRLRRAVYPMGGLSDLEARVADDSTTLNDARFRLNRPDPRLAESHLDEVDAFANEVAEPCLICHTVRHGTIDRVRPAQGVLSRATFDHGAHVLQRGCLDCHTAIPFEAHLGGDGPVDPALDNAAIQNLPAVGECRQCHTPDLASDGCLTCHDFHPEADVRSRLLR